MFERYERNNDEIAYIKIKNLAKFSNLIQKFEDLTNSRDFKSLFYYLNKIDDKKMEDSSSVENTDSVKLMTIHQAKGLEFPVVILAGVTNRRYSMKNMEEESLLKIPKELTMNQEEFERSEEIRRVFYVGMSRARNILVISTINGKGYRPSEFVDEIGRNTFINPEQLKEEFDEGHHHKSIKEKIKLSYSSVSAYIECPFRFYCRDYIGFSTPTDYYQVYGVIVHNALKKLHIMMKEGKNIDIRDIISIVDLYCKDDESKEKWRNELITDLWNYFEMTHSFINKIVDIELPFSYVDKDLVINGRADLIIKNKENKLEIIDYKSRYKEGLSRMNVDIQLRMYNLGLQNKYPEKIESISAYTFKDNQKTQFANSEEELQATRELISTISSSIESKVFKRNWKGSFCETKAGKCEFYYVCKNIEGEDKYVR